MAQSYQPGTAHQEARTEGLLAKTSGFYQKGPSVDGGWGFVFPRRDGTIDVVPARNAAVIGSGEEADVRISGPEVAPLHARVEARGIFFDAGCAWATISEVARTKNRTKVLVDSPGQPSGSKYPSNQRHLTEPAGCKFA